MKLIDLRYNVIGRGADARYHRPFSLGDCTHRLATVRLSSDQKLLNLRRRLGARRYACLVDAAIDGSFAVVDRATNVLVSSQVLQDLRL